MNYSWLFFKRRHRRGKMYFKIAVVSLWVQALCMFLAFLLIRSTLDSNQSEPVDRFSSYGAPIRGPVVF